MPEAYTRSGFSRQEIWQSVPKMKRHSLLSRVCFLIRSALLRLDLWQESYQFLNTPNMIGNASLHCWRYSLGGVTRHKL